MVYLAEIEEIFVKAKGGGLVLSPLDWLIAERWEEMGIPLKIISKGIKKSCGGLRKKDRRIDVLSYCEPKIFLLWKEHKNRLIGQPKDNKEIDKNSEAQYKKTYRLVLKKINKIKDELNSKKIEEQESLRLIDFSLSGLEYLKVLEKVEMKLKDDFSNKKIVDIEQIENMLRELDNNVIDNIISSLSKETKELFIEEINESIAPYRDYMDDKVYEESINMSLMNLIRDKYKVKRISLYGL